MTTKTASRQSFPKYKITVERTIGGFRSLSELANAKQTLKSKLSSASFTKPVKVGSSYRFRVVSTYIKAIAAPRDAVVEATKQSSPGAKVTVRRI